jgi:hypothetical protein
VTGRTEVVVTPKDDGNFHVEVRSPGGSTTHSVDVPVGMADELGWGGVPEAELVRASFEFLLEREPPTSILRQFSLDVICRYFPDYPAEIRRRRS